MPRCHWLPPGQQVLFTLAPFTLAPGVPEVVCAPSRGVSWLVMAAWDGQAEVARLRGSPQLVAKAAQDMAERTGNPVLVGQPAGLDAGGLPVFRALGRVVTAKADPYSPEAFEAWARSMASRVLRASESDLTALGTEALDHLDVRWDTATAGQIDAALAGYRTAIANPTTRMMNVQRVEVSRVLERVLRAAGTGALKIPEVRAAIGTAFDLNDKRVARLLSQHHSFWVRDRHGVISRDMSAMARAIISNGMSRGLGQVEIGRELSRMTGSGLRQPHYYRTVAANHVSRARSYSIGTSMRAAGIEYFRIQAVLDARTTHQCEYLHDKILPVSSAAANLDRIIADPNPESVLVHQPFIRDDGDRLTVPTLGGGRATVARIEQRGRHSTPQGPGGKYTAVMSQSDMVSAAIGLPPYHHNCRTTVIPA